mgnify:FL=1
MESKTQDHHWYGCTPFDWHVDNDLFKCVDMLNKLANSVGGKMETIPYQIYKIPHDISKHYNINYCAPQGVDAERIANGDFVIKKNSKKPRRKPKIEPEEDQSNYGQGA